jgi:hypothetical protein
MGTVKLDWFNEGKEFRPIVYPEDVEKCEAGEAKATGLHGFVMAHKEFLETVLPQSVPGVKLGETKLTVDQIQEAWQKVWNEVFKPIGDGDKTSPLSK